MRKDFTEAPLVYACSGCSSAAQMANYLAVTLYQLERAQMSCIAGVGGNVDNLVKLAGSGRAIMAIDGCPLACAKACLRQHAITPDYHIELSRFGVIKTSSPTFDLQEAKKLLLLLVEMCEQASASKMSHEETTYMAKRRAG